MDFKHKIGYYQAANYTEGRTMPIIAFVNHRMVGYLEGTTAHFQNPNTQTSSSFGVGIIDGKVKIRQFVPLDDTPWANGNYDASGSWDNWGYQTSQINAQTISIEHQDMDGTTAGKGIVKPEVQQASIDLQAFLFEGTSDEWRAAGIVLRDWNNFATIKEQILAIVPGSRTIITHNDISGKLKPYCWKPWAQDTVGFPRQKYIDGILYYTKPIFTADELFRAVQAATAEEVASCNEQVDALNQEIQSLTTDVENLSVANEALTIKIVELNEELVGAQEMLDEIVADFNQLEARDYAIGDILQVQADTLRGNLP